MSRSIAVVCEAEADRATACGLADRVICREVDWIAPDVLDAYRKWRGLSEAETHLRWKDVPALARQKNLRAYGHFDGQPGAADAHAARRALLLLKLDGGSFDGVLLLRDDDQQSERRTGLEQARAAVKLGVPILIGLAHPMRECWILAGFDPCNSDEQGVFDQVRREICFDPCSEAEWLIKGKGEIRSAKRILDLLTGGNRERQERCWTEADLTVLLARGEGTGLTAYLAELQAKLIPLFK